MISVIITVYNGSQFLNRAINSVLESTYKDIELIIVEDASTDNSLELLKQYIDPRIKIIVHKANLGAGLSRRHGIEAATGEYIITIDADDYISPTFLENLYNVALDSLSDIISGGITYIIDGKQKQLLTPSSTSTGFDKFKDYNDGKIVFLNNKLVKRSLYDKVPYCSRRYIEDTPTIIPLIYYANSITYIEDAGYYYMIRTGSLTLTASSIKSNLYNALCAIDCYEFLKTKEAPYNRILSVDLILWYISNLEKKVKSPEDIKEYANDYLSMVKWLKIFFNSPLGKSRLKLLK